MSEGDIALIEMPQADGQIKRRPALVLRAMPPFGDWLVCGISTQIRQQVPGFDEAIDPSHLDFAGSGLKAASLIRLGFLSTFPRSAILGKIGRIAPERHRRLLGNLAGHLLAHSQFSV
jgi:mRNA interferase MazF